VDGQTNTQNLSVEQATFSGQLQGQSSSAAASVDNAEIARLHRRNRFFQALWIAAGIILILLFTAAAILIWRNRSQVSQLTNAAERYKPVKLNLSGQPLQPGLQGVLAVNGDITATGTISAANLQGSGSGITNLQATNIVGILQPGQLDPFIAYTNKNFQVFFGTNQIFRNASNSGSAFEVQNASSAPILSVNTQTSFVGVDTAFSTQPNLSMEINGNAKNDGYLLVGAQSTQFTSILDVGSLFVNDIQRTLAVQSEITDNSMPSRIFTGSATELLVNPSINPATNICSGCTLGNLFAGSYSALEIAKTNPYTFPIVAGSLSSVTHAGSGTVALAVGQLNTVAASSVTPNVIALAAGQVSTSSLSNAGNIASFAGFVALDPNFLPGIIAPGSTGLIGNQIGVLVQDQHSSAQVGFFGSANIISQGASTNNYLEGRLAVGVTQPLNLLNPTLNGPVPFAGSNTLLVSTPSVNDSLAVEQITSSSTTSKPLVVQGKAGQTGNLTEWQNSLGTALSRVSADGSFSIGTGAPTNRLSVVDTSDDTVANFTGLTQTCTVDTSGAGGWSCSSDERLKKNIVKLDGGLDTIMQLRGVTYNFKSNPDGDAIAGFVAQEVEKILPGLVATGADGYKSLNKDGLIPYLVSAIQDQQKQIDTLKNPAGGVSVDVLKTLADSKAVEFGGDVTVNGNVIIKGILVGNTNTRGTVVIPAGQKSGGYSFSTTYSKIPNVVVSPSADTGGRYWLKSKSATGFTIELEAPQPLDTKFDWQAQE
jgi:hypothetical protein